MHHDRYASFLCASPNSVEGYVAMGVVFGHTIGNQQCRSPSLDGLAGAWDRQIQILKRNIGHW